MTKILLFGEPLIRISPLDATSIGDHVASSTYFGGSEINIACNLQAPVSYTHLDVYKRQHEDFSPVKIRQIRFC